MLEPRDPPNGDLIEEQKDHVDHEIVDDEYGEFPEDISETSVGQAFLVVVGPSAVPAPRGVDVSEVVQQGEHEEQGRDGVADAVHAPVGEESRRAPEDEAGHKLVQQVLSSVSFDSCFHDAPCRDSNRFSREWRFAAHFKLLFFPTDLSELL